MEPFAKMTEARFAALFEAMGRSSNPMARLLSVMLPRAREFGLLDDRSRDALMKSGVDASGRMYVSMSFEQLSEAMGNANANTVRRAVRAALSTGLIRVSVPGRKGTPAIYEAFPFAYTNTRDDVRESDTETGKCAYTNECEHVRETPEESTYTDTLDDVRESGKCPYIPGEMPLHDHTQTCKSLRVPKSKAIAEQEKEEGDDMPPTLKEFRAYFKPKYPDIDVDKLYGIFEADGWKDANGEPIKYWRSYCDRRAREWQQFAEAEKGIKPSEPKEHKSVEVLEDADGAKYVVCPSCGHRARFVREYPLHIEIKCSNTSCRMYCGADGLYTFMARKAV